MLPLHLNWEIKSVTQSFNLEKNLLQQMTKFYVKPPWEEGTYFLKNNLGHMTKMAAVSIYGKKVLQNHVQRHMILKLSLQHRRLKIYR